MGTACSQHADKREEPPLGAASDIIEDHHETVPVLRATCDYTAGHRDNLSFTKGEKLCIINSDNSDDNWWYAEKHSTKQVGFIPRILSYDILDNSIGVTDLMSTSFGSFVDVDCDEARYLLNKNHQATGAFLVRRSPASSSGFTLSVRGYDTQTSKALVRHYRIEQSSDTRLFSLCVSPRQFLNIDELTQHHKEQTDGVCDLLGDVISIDSPPVALHKLEIDIKSLTWSKKIGSGHFGDVWAAHLPNGQLVAVKTRKADAPGCDLLSEAHRMHQLAHRHLVRLIGICSCRDDVCIVLEMVVNGDLRNYLRERRGHVSLEDRLEMARQISSGMSYLEDKYFIHRDLRAANILVSNDLTMKVADFGLTRRVNKRDAPYTSLKGVCPVKWTAPEALKGNFTIKSDVWSFAIVLYEICTFGKDPYPDMDAVTVKNEVLKGYYMPQPPDGCCPDALYKLKVSCWQREPTARPSFKHIFCEFRHHSEKNAFTS